MNGSNPAGRSAIRPAALHTATLAAFFAASSAPTPLYRFYQQAWGFSAMTLTLAFGIYAVTLLLALLTFGSFSDHVGRKPVILSALALEILSMGLFAAASGTAWLLAARVVQGWATGMVGAAAGAALLDCDRERGPLINSISPLAGIGLGALGSSLLVQFAPAPLRLVYALLLVVFVVLATLTARSPETGGTRPGALASLRPSVAVPARARSALAWVSPLNTAIWALSGFYLSLMPSLIAKVTGLSGAWPGGIAVAALTGSGAFSVLAASRRSPDAVLSYAAMALAAGLVAIVGGANLGLTAVLVAGSVVAGIGLGAGFLAAVRAVMPLAAPQERAGLMAAFYIESYLALSLPAIAAGYLAQRFGLLTAIDLYGASIAVLAVASIALARMRKRASACLAAAAAPRTVPRTDTRG